MGPPAVTLVPAGAVGFVGTVGLNVCVTLLYPPGPAKFGVLAGGVAAGLAYFSMPGCLKILPALNPAGLPAGVFVAVGAGAVLLAPTVACGLRSASRSSTVQR